MDINEALNKFRAGPAILHAALEGVQESQLDVVPAPGKWTIRQIVQHLMDTEIVAGMRFRQILAEERPTLVPFDQEAWAKNMQYAPPRPVTVVLTVFSTLRNETASLLDGAPPEAFSRVGVHPERGDKTLSEWVEIFGRHVETHAGQIRAIREKASS